MPNLLSRLGSSFKAFVFGGSKYQNIGQAYDADLSKNKWPAPKPTTSSTGQRGAQLVRPPAHRADAANRRRLLQSRTPLLPKEKATLTKAQEEQVALTKAQEAVDSYQDFKDIKHQLKVRLGPVRDQKTDEEKIALTLVKSAIASDKELKNKQLQFYIETLPLPTAEELDAENLAKGIALSEIQEKLDSQKLRGDDVSNWSPSSDKKEMEEVALALARVAAEIESDPGMTNNGVQLDISALPLTTQEENAKNLAKGIALSVIQQELDSLKSGYQYDVRIVPPNGEKTSLEEVAMGIKHKVIEQDLLLKDTGLKVDIRIISQLHQALDDKSFESDFAIPKKEPDTAFRTQPSSSKNSLA